MTVEELIVYSLFAIAFVKVAAKICCSTYFNEKRRHLLGLLNDEKRRTVDG